MKNYNFRPSYEWMGTIRVKAYDLKQARKRARRIISKHFFSCEGKKISLKCIAIGGRK